MATYFTADTHFNHEGIIKHCHRAYRSVAEMNADIVAKWNAVVQRESDIVWVLGDFAFKHPAGDDVVQLFYRLRGTKCLVVGNHDERNPQVLRLPWERQADLVTFRDNDRRAILCHYPLETWKGAHRGYLHFHGHSHGSLRRTIPHRFDVGWDVLGAPVDFEQLWENAQRQSEYKPQDHHA